MNNKEWLRRLKPLVNNNEMYSAYLEMIDFYVEQHIRKLELSPDPVEMYRAQGQIMALKKLKTLKDEVNA